MSDYSLLNAFNERFGETSQVSRDDGYPHYRYRMTVEVEKPDGAKTGPSVIEVQTDEVETTPR